MIWRRIDQLRFAGCFTFAPFIILDFKDMTKKMLLIICLTALALNADAQSFLRWLGIKPAYKLKNELSISWGLVENPFEMYGDDTPDWPGGRFEGHTPWERYDRSRYSYSDRIYTQALSVGFTQELSRWLALGMQASYSGQFQSQRLDGITTDRLYTHRFAFYPAVRFTYLNRPMVRLYSGLGLGIGMKWNREFFDRDVEYSVFPTGQVTFFGVSVGRQLFANWELGYGVKGYLTLGMGYRW
jgi:hypothetical protein